MKIQEIVRSIRQMPRPAYLMLRFVLAVCCAMLLCALAVYFRIDEAGIHNCRQLRLALLLTENPAGVLLLGGIMVYMLIDRAR